LNISLFINPTEILLSINCATAQSAASSVKLDRVGFFLNISRDCKSNTYSRKAGPGRQPVLPSSSWMEYCCPQGRVTQASLVSSF